MTEQECTPKFKLGDLVWTCSGQVVAVDETTLGLDDGDGIPYYVSQSFALPDSQALPAVARLLVSDGDTLRSALVAIYDANLTETDQVVARKVARHQDTLRALIAALTGV